MQGLKVSLLDRYDGRVATWCVRRNNGRLHIIATYVREGVLNPKYTLKSVRLGGCGCEPLEEVPAEVLLEAEKLWQKC